MTKHIDDALIGYVMRYGGMCRDCADMDGVCQSGMPCDTDQRRSVIRHTIAALAYGINNGFIASPFTDTTALAAAEERGRIDERESAVWLKVPKRPPLELLKSINVNNQVLAYENGRYYNAWFSFDEFDGGWFWTDDADSEPNPSHYRKLDEPPAITKEPKP